MSSSNDRSSYICQSCGTTNTNQTQCIQCQSNVIDEIPNKIINREEQQLLNDDSQIETFNNIFLPLFVPQSPRDNYQYRSRRHRQTRRIKRIKYRSIPSFDLSIIQPNMNIIHIPIELFVDNSNILEQLFGNDFVHSSLTNDDINRLPTLTITQSNLSVNSFCSICLENFQLSIEVKQLPLCHHMFHLNCLTEWLLHHDTCPMCRTVVSINSQIPILPVNNQQIQQLNSPIKNIIPQEILSNNIHQLPRFDSSSDID